MGEMQKQKGMMEMANGNIMKGKKDISQGQAKINDGNANGKLCTRTKRHDDGATAS